MEPRFTTEAPLLPHTREEEPGPHHSRRLLSKLTMGRAPPLQLLGTASSCPKRGGRAESEPCLVTL